MPTSVVIDTAAGLARVGSLTVPVAETGRDGELRVGGQGPTLRPLRFGERLRICSRARRAPDPRAALAGGVTAAAVVAAGDGATDAVLLEVLALALAGAGEEAPPFAEAAALVARAAAWEPAQLLEIEAAQVDRLARGLAPHAPQAGLPDGTTRIVFAPAAADELARMRADLVDDLLGRAGAGDDELAALAPAGARGAAGAETDGAPARPGSTLAPDPAPTRGGGLWLRATKSGPDGARSAEASWLGTARSDVGGRVSASPSTRSAPGPETASAEAGVDPSAAPDSPLLPTAAPRAAARPRETGEIPGNGLPGMPESAPASPQPPGRPGERVRARVLSLDGRPPARPAEAAAASRGGATDFVARSHEVRAPVARPRPASPGARPALAAEALAALAAPPRAAGVREAAPAPRPSSAALGPAVSASAPAVQRASTERASAPPSARELAGALGRLLHEEADLRGVER